MDVVVPFAGTDAELAAVRARVARLALGAGDSARVVDNRGQAERSSYFARNRGAEVGTAEWLLFVDADVEFDGDLIDRLFARAPEERTAVLAGAVADAVVEDTWVARWLREEGAMSQSRTLGGARPYAQTAHCAVRRAAFEAVGGFTEGIRSGGDADLCFRLADAGWALEERDAVVRHVARARLRPLLAQRARHGAGAAWLEQRYPGTFPETARPVGLAWWLARSLPAGRTALLPPLTALAFAAGRRRSNAVPRG